MKISVRVLTYFVFCTGFFLGFFIASFFQLKENENYTIQNPSRDLYDSSLAQMMHRDVKILCWVFTHPANHKVRAIHLKNTWGHKCNKLLFMSSAEDPDLPEIVLIPGEDGRKHLWKKTQQVYQYVYDKYLNEYDWFMRADDDNYINMENLRYLLYQYRPQTSFYIGHRFAQRATYRGFMAGGGHLFSRKALKKMVEDSFNTSRCLLNEDEFDDLITGNCLGKNSIFVNELDDMNQKRFFPIGVGEHFGEELSEMWYKHYMWFNTSMGDLSCCSDTFCMMHYVSHYEVYLLNYFTYSVHPFGIDKNTTEVLPRKPPLDEVIARSNIPGTGIHYFDIPDRAGITYLELEDSERY